ncbi:MAG: M23 family metallopeptidase [Gemmatimonadetes bacterium]|nr:M23 family metallopeptidase [Gemmatimonadota bacterium]
MKRRVIATMLVLAGGCRGLQPLPPPQAPVPGRDLPAEERPPEGETAGHAVVPDDHTALLTRALLIPVRGVRPDQLRDSFRAARGDRVHAALDIMAPRGTPVVAADGGLLWKVRSNALGGLTVYILDDEQRFVYYYAHLDRYADDTKEGRRVEKGAVLGYVGTTGNAPPNAPHLHFQLMKYRGDGRWWDGEPINPFPYLTASRGTP